MHFLYIFYAGKTYNTYFKICFDNRIIFMNYSRDHNNIYCQVTSLITECNHFKLIRILGDVLNYGQIIFKNKIALKLGF